MSKTKPKHDANTLPVAMAAIETDEKAKARAALQPSINAVLTIDAYKGNFTDGVDLPEMVHSLRSTIKEVQGGDLSRLEAMLVAQATTLQTMFTSLAIRAANQSQVKHYDVFAGLALKAQAQSRATISALVDLKYPRQATFVKQANIAHGPQQINNTEAGRLEQSGRARVRKNKTDQTELLEVDQHGSTTVDRRAAPTAAGSDPTMETVGAGHRAKNPRGKGKSVTQR